MEASTRSLQFSFMKRVKHRNFSFTNYVGKGTTSPAIESNRKKNLSFAKTKKMYCGIYEEKSERELYANSECFFGEIWPENWKNDS